MLYATAGMLYGSISITLSQPLKKALAVFLTVGIFAVSVGHALLGHVSAFRTTFVCMVLIVTGQLIYLVSTKLPDPKIKQEGKYLALYGTGGLFAFSGRLMRLTVHPSHIF
jgi:uncharacterized membrane protein